MADGLAILNPHPRKLPGPSLLHHLVPGQSGDGSPAIEHLSRDDSIERVTYQQLHARANAVAYTLRTDWNAATLTSVPAYFIAPILVPQCVELYVAELAALKAGAAFCPIGLDIPEERLRFILNDVNARVLLTTTEVSAGLPALEGIKVILVDTTESASNHEDPEIDVAPSQPAYIMYTSGSTGQPKGVVLSHMAATQSILAHDCHIPAFSRFLQFASPTFDVSVFEIFFPLFRGRTVVSGDRRLLLNDLPAFINRMNINAAELTPSVASTLLHGRADLPSLRVLLTIGEMLKRDVVEEFGASGSEEGILHGMYGPTEAAIHCTLQTSFVTTMSMSNIGVPLDTVSAFIIAPISSDHAMGAAVEILAIGEEGELVIGGHQLADEYLNRPNQTAASFINHPEYGRLYRTGDRARLTSRGLLECLGRLSSGQVKLRGQRVELGEIEYAASITTSVRSTVAEVINGNAVVFCVSDTEVTHAQIRKTCQKWLPAFMVPAECMILRTLPYLPSGKVDRTKLRDLYDQQASSQLAADSERSETRGRILNIISAVLKAPVDAQSRLSAIGMDSLSSIRISSELRRAGFSQLDATIMLESETVQDVETRLMQLEASCQVRDHNLDSTKLSSRLWDAVCSHPVISGLLDRIEDVYAPTAVQLAMLSETARDVQAYCNWIKLSVAGYSIDRVHESLQQLVSHHSLLRSGFVSVNDSSTPFAIIVWKTLSPVHLVQSNDLGHGHAIRNEKDLLSPCYFQLKENNSSVRIILQIHHALYDQWSIDVLRSDLECLLLDQTIPPSVSFHDVAAYQNTSRQDLSSQPSADFWQDLLLDFTPTPLPSMRATRVARKLHRSMWHTLINDLPSVRHQCRNLGFTIPTVFQASLSYLLGNYAGSSDVTFGVVFSGRNIPLPGIEQAFGPCLATLPFRVDYSATESRLDLLRETQSRNRDMQKHAPVPLVDIKRMSGCATDAKLFNTLFLWQESTISRTQARNIIQEVDSFDNHEFDLVIEFESRGNNVQARVTYQESLISSDQVRILIEQLKAVSESILSEPNAPVSTLTDCFPNNLRSISNPCPKYFAPKCNLVATIESHAAKRPDSPALIFAKSIQATAADVETLTYAELNARSNKLASCLQSLKVLPDDLVCICMDKSIYLYISILAAIKAGAGYLPITPDTPKARLESILTQSQVKVCLCDDSSIEMFRSLTATTAVNVSTADTLHLSTDSLAIEPSGSTLAYTVFTSGSTGQPKGVMVSYENLLGNLQVLEEMYQVTPGDRLLQACSQAFDVSVFEIFFAFYTGMCLCSASKDELFRDIEMSIRTLRISHLSLTPTVAALVHPDNVPDVKFLVTAGEGITELVHRYWAGKGLHQGYGPSETTNICTLNMHVSRDHALGNIGHPLANTSAFVISSESAFDILPLGSMGEFAFGGEQVFRGYAGMHALNAEKLIDHPQFSRVYKSGDFGRILPNGALLINGRKDDQVKIRGNRIELGEINAILLNTSHIRDSATLVVETETCNHRLASFVVLEPDRTSAIGSTGRIPVEDECLADLFASLEQSLPSYMIPEHIVPLNQLPVTSQGKLDKQELRRLFQSLDGEGATPPSRTHDQTENATDWSLEEYEIAAALKDTIHISASAISRNRHFVSLGLNSLNAIFFARAINARLKIPVAVSTVLQNSTISRLAQVLSHEPASHRLRPDLESAPLLPAPVIAEAEAVCSSFKGNIERILTCTPLQEAMLAASSTSSGSKYCNHLSLLFHGDVERMRKSWKAMIDRHSILRTTFVSTTDRVSPYVQVVLKDLPLPWREQSLAASTSPASKGASVNNDISSIVSHASPFAIRIQSVDAGMRLKLYMHHAIYDAISIERLLREVELVYRGNILPEPTQLEPFLSEVQRQNGEDAIRFWRAELKSFMPITLPLMPTLELREEIMLHKALSISQSDLNLFCQKYAVSHLAMFQAALVKVLACCQRTEDVCFGNVISGRTVPVEGVETLVAPCFNTVPMRTRLKDTRTNSALMRYLSKRNTDMLPYQLTSLRCIQRLSSDPAMHLFDSLLLFQPGSLTREPSVLVKEAESGNMDVPLVFEIIPAVEGYRLTLHFLTSHVSSTTARRLTEAYSVALVSCMKFPYSDVVTFHDFNCNDMFGCLRSEADANHALSNTKYISENEWSSEEETIRQVYSQLSKRDQHAIKRHTSMYQLGLDSLNAPQIAARLRHLGFNVDAADVIESLTPAALAALVKAKSSIGVDRDARFDFTEYHRKHLPNILKCRGTDEESVEAIRPCTSVQNGMLAQSITSDGKLYINHITYSIPQEVSVANIRAALNLVINRHQVLRMGFHRLDDGQNPFAMVIFRPGTTVATLLKESSEQSHENCENHASKRIMDSLDTQPWLVTIQKHMPERTMMLSIHHALYDARSLVIILEDFATALSGISLQRKTNIDALLQSHLAAEADHEGQASKYWQKILLDVSVCKFPDLTPTSLEKGKLLSEKLTSALTASILEEFCRSNQTTVQALGQTAWAVLLAAYTGNESVVFGTIYSGQTTTDGLKVAFPSILAIPVPCNTNRPPMESVHAMVEFNAFSQRHRFLPLSDILRSAGHTDCKLFDTVFVYQKALLNEVSFRWSVVRETAAVAYCASLELETHTDDKISTRLTYDTSIIPPKQARFFVQQYDHILSQLICENYKAPESVLSILPPLEPTLSSSVELLHEFVERSAQKHPSRPALEFVHATRTEVWSYAKLDGAATQVAHLIQRSGIQPNGMIAVSMNKCPEASLAFLGILKAGCSFLAIDPDLPESRSRFILEDSRSRLLFGDQAEPPKGTPEATKYVQLTQSMLASLPITPVRARRVTSSSTCYCLYTSGTTGTPKGCEISHENAVQAMLAFMRLFRNRWNESSKWLQFASYWFDVSVLEQFWSWAVGITVVGAARDLVLEDLPGFVRRLNISHIDLTPSLARLVNPDEVPSLCNGVFITGGEPLKQDIITAWGPARTVCNGYGPTEATIGVTMNTFIGQDAKSSNIGRQFDNVGTYVLHPGTDELVLRGTIGELCVSGKLVGKGYLNQPDLTAKCFPFLERFGETVYRTGDLVRMLEDGSFVFVGRADSQSKLRGQRLELTEIESAIRLGSDQIHDVVTLITSNREEGKETLVAFIATAARTKTDQICLNSSERSIQLIQQAREACRSHLPGYMIPTHILAVNQLPLTVNNKIDAKKLTAMFLSTSMKDLQALEGREIEARPLNETERSILRILQRMLQLEAVDVAPQTNLFSTGLSSISAIPFTASLKQAGFQHASIGVVMRNSSLETLGQALSNTIRSLHEEDSVQQARLWMTAFCNRHLPVTTNLFGVSTEDIEAVVPCTPLQQGLIIESLKADGRPHFNEFHYELVNSTTSAMKAFLEKWVASTQILRTRFTDTDEGFAQVVLRQCKIELSTWNIPSAHLGPLLADLMTRWQSRNESSISMPLHFHLIDADKKSYLIVHIHHALYDGISYDLMLDKLCDISHSATEPDLIPSFTDALAHGPLRPTEGTMEFWKNRLQDTKYVPLQKDKAGAASKSTMICLSLGSVEGIEATRKFLGVSHQAIVQSCFEFALYRHQPAIELYGVVCSGRSIDLEGADKVVGPMFNTLPQPLRMDLLSTMSEHVQRCHLSNTASIPFQHTPLRDIRKWCGQQFLDGIFDVLFVFHHVRKQSVDANNRPLRKVETAQSAHYALSCEAEMDATGCINVTLLAQEPFFAREALEDLQDNMLQTLECLLKCPDTQLQDIIGVTTRSLQSKPFQHRAPTEVSGTQDFRWTPEAHRVREIIAQLSGQDLNDVGEHSSIFSLGLDSIDAVKVASRLKHTGLAIPVSKLLQAQTIPRILECVQQQSVASDQPDRISSVKMIQQQITKSVLRSLPNSEDIEEILPATPLQEALIAGMVRSELNQYFHHDVLRLEPNTGLEELKAAWQSVVDASPILRTSFLEISNPEIDCIFAQIVHSSATLQVSKYQCSSPHQFEEIFEEIRGDVLSKLPSSPPFRLSTISVQSERYLVLSLAHALYDGHSIALLHEDAHRAYENEFDARPSYEDTIDAILSSSQDDSEAYWKSMLANSQIHSFPRAPEAVNRSRPTRAERCSDVSTHEARSWCREYGVSMQALAQTCWTATLAHYVRHLDVRFGVVLACRDSEEQEQMMFPMMNTVVVRSTLHGSRAKMVQHMQGLITDMRPYQRTPLRKIQALAAQDGSHNITKGNNGLFDTLFIYQQRPKRAGEDTNALYQSVDGQSAVEYPVATEIEAIGGSLIIRASCSNHIMDEDGTTQLLEKMDKVLQAVIRYSIRPTVEFHQDGVSVCGLDPVSLHSTSNASVGLDSAGSELQSGLESASSSLMPTIVQVLSEVSKTPVEEISPVSTVEGIGIDSISAIKVAALLRKQSINITVSGIIRARTPARIAETASTPVRGVSNSGSEGERAATPVYNVPSIAIHLGLAAYDIEAVLPATAGQIYMLSMWKETEGQQFYSTFSYRLDASLPVEQIENAWTMLVGRHAILRTVFCIPANLKASILQVVFRDAPTSIVLHGKSAVTQPMVSMQATKESNGMLLEISIHHALYDAVSLPLLIQNFQSLLAGKSISESEVNFENFLALSTAPRAKAAQREFWIRYLQNLRPQQLPQSGVSGAQDRVEIFKPQLFSSALRLENKARKESLTTQALLFAAYAKIYVNIANYRSDNIVDEEERDVIVGMYLSNRSHLADLDTLPAPTLNLVPLAVRAPHQKSLLEIAGQIHIDLQNISTVENSAVGLSEIYEWTGLKVDTVVNFLKLPEREQTFVQEGDGSSVVLEVLDERRTRERSEVVPAGGDEWEIPPELGELSTEAYQHSLDIEMMTKGGNLGVGLFCPVSMLGLEDAEKMMEDLRMTLEKLVGKEKQVPE